MGNLSVTERYVRAYPTDKMPALVEDLIELDASRTAFVSLHCWNIGFPGGPAVPRDYWVFMGSRANHELCIDVTNNKIAPALAAARDAGLRVIHVQTPEIAAKHRGSPPAVDSASPDGKKSLVVGGYERTRAERVHGPGFRNWAGWSEVDIAPSVFPLPDEPVVATGAELDATLRELGIVNLVYVGFAANLCILDSPAAMKEMAGIGYRCMLIRECTLAVEFEDTLPWLSNTQSALRYVEAWVGSTLGHSDFTAACSSLAERMVSRNSGTPT